LIRKDRVSAIIDSYIGFSQATVLAKTEVISIQLHHPHKDNTSAIMNVRRSKDGSFVPGVLTLGKQCKRLESLRNPVVDFAEHGNSLLALCVHVENINVWSRKQRLDRRDSRRPPVSNGAYYPGDE